MGWGWVVKVGVGGVSDLPSSHAATEIHHLSVC